MNYFSISRLTRFDVRWANLHKGNSNFHKTNHSNPFFEILMVIEGPIYMQIGSERLELKSGEAFILKPWEQHSGWREMSEESSFYWIQFQCDPHLDEFQLLTNTYEKFNFIHTPKNELRTQFNQDFDDSILLPRRSRPDRRFQLLSLFEKIMHEFAHPVGYFHFRLNLLLGSIMEMIANDLLEHYQKDTNLPISFITYRNLISLLNENYTKELTKEWIEKELSRKYEYLCQVFKKNSGINISTYIQQLRIQRAKHLLLNSTRTMNDISTDIGYQDALYFSRIFKKVVGLSPSQYRQCKEE
jgi:AraC-like DNA-binding protein